MFADRAKIYIRSGKGGDGQKGKEKEEQKQKPKMANGILTHANILLTAFLLSLHRFGMHIPKKTKENVSNYRQIKTKPV